MAPKISLNIKLFIITINYNNSENLRKNIAFVES